MVEAVPLPLRAEVHAGELKQVWMALQWAQLHPAPVDADGVVTDDAGWGDPTLLAPTPGREVTELTPLAGPGAPLVSDLAPLALGAALGRSHDHARQLFGDALEHAHHRFPLAQDGRVPVWLARQISRDTHDLSLDAVTPADRLICAVPDKEETCGAVTTDQLAAWVRRRTDTGGLIRVRAGVTGGRPRDGRCATSSTTRDDTWADARDDARGLVTVWLARRHVTAPVIALTPIDLDDDACVDTHDPPPLLREQVVLWVAPCVFPGCRRDSRTCDLDHLEPYVPPDDGGPPGQTRASNLAPLCRRHHDARTHHGWRYRRRDDGSHTWTSPTGHTYDVRPHSRAPLDL